MKNLLLNSSLIIVLAMILPLNMWGQNLVMNGSAEIINTCNLTSGYIGNASGWYSPNNSSPDVLNECSNNPFYAIPNNQLGYRFAMEGKGYLGIYNSSNLDESIQIYEYISTKLEKSLKPEYKYCISFYVALGQKASNCAFDSIVLPKNRTTD